MATTMSERTVLPPNHPESLSGLVAALRPEAPGQAPALVDRDGDRVELPDELFEVLRDVATALSQGLAVSVTPQHTTLTTSEAAGLLGVSRPTLVRLLDQGEIPFEKPARHRRVRLADLLAYQQRARRARAAGLDQMVRDSEEAGVYAVPEAAGAERIDPDEASG